MRYVALRALKLPPDGAVTVQPGEEVPGASEWRNPKLWERTGWIRPMTPGEIAAADKGRTPPKPEPEPEPAPASGNDDALQALHDALLETNEDPKSHKIVDLVDLAVTAGVEVPESLPRSKAGVVETLAEIAGLEV